MSCFVVNGWPDGPGLHTVRQHRQPAQGLLCLSAVLRCDVSHQLSGPVGSGSDGFWVSIFLVLTAVQYINDGNMGGWEGLPDERCDTEPIARGSVTRRKGWRTGGLGICCVALSLTSLARKGSGARFVIFCPYSESMGVTVRP